MAKVAAFDEENQYRFTKIVGAKFKPTDSILVDYYLAGKVCGRTDGPVFQFIKDVDVYECEPEKLSRYEPYGFDDNPRKYYFFTTLKMIKTKKGRNVNRSVKVDVGDGFWKITGKFIDVKNKDEIKIGAKTSLAYYKNGQKTDWLMTEYRLGDNKYGMLKKECKLVDEENKMLALCVVYHNGKKRRKSESENKWDDINVDPQSSKQITVAVPDPPPSLSRGFSLPDPILEELLRMFSDENLENAPFSYNIPVSDSEENIPISGMGSNSQSGANEPVTNILNSETASALWSSVPSAQNSYPNCPKHLIISSAGNPSVPSVYSSMLNSSSCLQQTYESFVSNQTHMQFHSSPPDYGVTLENLPGSVHCNNTVTGYSQDDQGPVSTVQIPNDHCQYHIARMIPNDLWPLGGNLNHNLQQSSADFDCPHNPIIYSAGPNVASGDSSMLNLSTNPQETHESSCSNHIHVQSHGNPIGCSVHCNNTVIGYSQDDQGPVSTVQIPNDRYQNHIAPMIPKDLVS